MEYVTISPPFLESARALSTSDQQTYADAGSRIIHLLGPQQFSCGVFSQFGEGRSAKANGLSLYYHQLEQQSPHARQSFFVALFESPYVSSKKDFDDLLDQHLKAMHKMDSQFYDAPGFKIRSEDRNEFEFSFGGRLYGVRDFHPAHPEPENQNDLIMLLYSVKYNGRQLFAPKQHTSSTQVLLPREA